METQWPPAPEMERRVMVSGNLTLEIEGESLRVTQPQSVKQERRMTALYAVFATAALVNWVRVNYHVPIFSLGMLKQLEWSLPADAVITALIFWLFGRNSPHRPFCIRRHPRTFQRGNDAPIPLPATAHVSVEPIGNQPRRIYKLSLTIPDASGQKAKRMTLAVSRSENAQFAKDEIDQFLNAQ